MHGRIYQFSNVSRISTISRYTSSHVFLRGARIPAISSIRLAYPRCRTCWRYSCRLRGLCSVLVGYVYVWTSRDTTRSWTVLPCRIPASYDVVGRSYFDTAYRKCRTDEIGNSWVAGTMLLKTKILWLEKYLKDIDWHSVEMWSHVEISPSSQMCGNIDELEEQILKLPMKLAFKPQLLLTQTLINNYVHVWTFRRYTNE